MPDQNSISFKALREYCQQLGLTPATTGQPIDRLIGQARQTDDPRAWLAALSNAPPEEDAETRRGGDAEKMPPAAPGDLVEPESIPTHESLRQTLPSPSPRLPISMQAHLLDVAAAIQTVALTVPIADDEPSGYLEREMHLDVRLDAAASRAFRRLWKALDGQNARLTTGRHVGKSRADVVRWMFEQLATALEVQIIQ
jgi:hypothetical protein